MKLPHDNRGAARLLQRSSCNATQSGGGPPHSKTLRAEEGSPSRASVLECASPLALFPRAATGVQSSAAGALSGFTLIEVMISSALMAMILVSAYLCLGAGFSAQKMIEPRAEIIQNARVALALVSADLRAACPLSKTDDFLGMARTVGDMEADNLDFGTHNYAPRHAHEGDFCQESIYLDKDAETGRFSLWRRRNPTIGLDALSGGAQEELAQGVVGLKFEYYDGLDWFATWGEVDKKKSGKNSTKTQSNLTGMPEAVRITLLMDSNPRKKTQATAATSEENPAPPFVFRTVVRLNLASVTQNASGASDASSTDNNSSPGQPGNGN